MNWRMPRWGGSFSFRAMPFRGGALIFSWRSHVRSSFRHQKKKKTNLGKILPLTRWAGNPMAYEVYSKKYCKNERYGVVRVFPTNQTYFGQPMLPSSRDNWESIFCATCVKRFFPQAKRRRGIVSSEAYDQLVRELETMLLPACEELATKFHSYSAYNWLVDLVDWWID